MSDWIDDPSCSPTTLTHVGVAADQTINNNTANDPAKCVDPEECAGTGTKILYAVGGGALGFLGAWFLSDQQKKAAQDRAYSVARETGDGFRRGWSAPRASNPAAVAESAHALAHQIITSDNEDRLFRARVGAQRDEVARSLMPGILRRFESVLDSVGDRQADRVLEAVHERAKYLGIWRVFIGSAMDKRSISKRISHLVGLWGDTLSLSKRRRGLVLAMIG